MLRYILSTLLLIAAFQAAGQYSIDTVCVGSVGYYRVDGEPGNAYTWKVTDPAGNVVTLPGNADTVAISWSMTPGIYKLSTIQHSLTTNCDGLLEIGDILVRDQAVPTFAPVGPFCMNSTPSLLPGISTNGITGSWMPAIISTGTVGTSTYTFTPDAGQCAVVVNLVIETTDQLIPAFDTIDPLCLNSTAPSLPSTSINSIAGTWSPSTISTAVIGVSTYTFTPDSLQCAGVTTIGVQVTNLLTPVFDSIGPVCLNSTAPLLPSTSTNSITGTWSPSTISTAVIGVSTYTFTPDSMQCAGVTTIEVQVTDLLTPVFDSIGPLCQNAAPPLLPSTSVNGITGTWSPSTISTATIGVSAYTFTSDPMQCGGVTTIGIEVTNQLTPVFDSIGPLCQNTAPPSLPSTSANGITGTWSPATINTATIGVTTYTFTPDSMQCGGVTTIGVEVTNLLTPIFDPIGPLCQNSGAPSLPATSSNGISGSWVPANIRTDLAGLTTYTFTPDSGQCAGPVSIEVEVTGQIVPLFASLGPLCLNSTSSDLPRVSDNYITGTWELSAIATGTVGLTNYTFTPDPGQCSIVVTMGIVVTDKLIPTFDSLGPLCFNSPSSALPRTSKNGVTGTWVRAATATNIIGITNYTFTPDSGQCGKVVTMGIAVTNLIVPAFLPIGPLCLNSSVPELPATSVNGIPGTWEPAVISTSAAGFQTYMFTPDSGQCGAAVSLKIEVVNKSIPQFEPIGPLCMNSAAPGLPSASVNGIHGTWMPDSISTANSGTTTYIFTPDAGECSMTATLDVTVPPLIIATFDTIGPVYQNNIAPILPVTSTNGITGNWNPPVIDLSTVGTSTYTFTPDAGLCPVVITMNITVYAPVIPAITIAADKNPICIGTPVTFTATVINQGTNPAYRWFKNGIPVGHNLPNYVDSILVDSDVVTCNLISELKDPGIITTKSSEITMVVYVTKAAFTITENFNNLNGNVFFTNASTGADYYLWDFGNGQTSSDENPYCTYTEDGTYLVKLTATNSLNCSDTVSYKYEMLFKGLYIPNAFAPNATTTLGSVFQPSGIGLKRFRVEVYDNWGHLMWQSTALDAHGTPTESWDGTCDGKPMPQGTYLWKVYAVFYDDTIWKGSDNGAGKGSEIGTVLLIR